MKNEIVNVNTLEKYSNDFIDYLDVDELTLKTYKVGIENFMCYLKNNNITNPTRDNVVSYRDYLRDNYSSSTINTYIASVRALFRYLKLNNMYEDLAQDIKGAKYSTVPKKQILTKDQAKEIYNSLTDPREKCLFSLALSTGLRGIEIARAKIEDIKIHNGEYVLWVQCKMRDEKDEYVKLSGQVMQDIRNYVESRTNGYIFTSTSNHNKDNGVTTTTLRRIIKSIFKRFGLDDDTFSLHSTRRSAATYMYEQTKDIYKVQQVLHHKSSTTTSRYINAVTRNENNSEYLVSNLLFS